MEIEASIATAQAEIQAMFKSKRVSQKQKNNMLMNNIG